MWEVLKLIVDCSYVAQPKTYNTLLVAMSRSVVKSMLSSGAPKILILIVLLVP